MLEGIGSTNQYQGIHIFARDQRGGNDCFFAEGGRRAQHARVLADATHPKSASQAVDLQRLLGKWFRHRVG